MRKSPLARFFRFVAQSLLITLVIFGVFEGVIRLTHSFLPSRLQPDPVLHHKWVPGTRFEVQCEGDPMAAVHSVVRSVNEFGHLDGELGSNYSSSEVRKLVILGDSSVQGLTPPRFTFPEQLRDQLGSYFSDRNLEYDVLNLGVPGYSPKIVLLQLRQLLAESRPDLVIVAFDMRTDFENWKYSHSEQRDSEGGLTAVSPLSPSEIGFFEDVDGVHPYQWIFEFARTVRERSAFARWISRFILHTDDVLPRDSEDVKKFPFVQADSEGLHSRGIYTPWSWCRDSWDALTENAVEDSLRDISQIVQFAKQSQVPIIVTSVPVELQYKYRRGGSPAWSLKPHKEIERVVTANGGIYFDLYSVLQEEIQTHLSSLYFCEGDYRLSSLGNMHWADAMRDTVEQQLSLEVRPNDEVK